MEAVTCRSVRVYSTFKYSSIAIESGGSYKEWGGASLHPPEVSCPLDYMYIDGGETSN